MQIDIVADITGGDSFSDIYGMRRFLIGFLRKWLVLLFNKDLVMLPQTYGPFKRSLTRVMARYILKRTKLIYSRDRAGVEYLNSLLNNRGNGKVRFVPDVAFVLDARKPEHLDIEPSA
jgi:polysaccharide pyruvyl transferase WcaK-like protein